MDNRNTGSKRNLSGNTGSITFNPDGSISSISPNPPVLTFLPEDGASQQNVVLNFGEDFAGITQTSDSSVVSALSQNGSAAASLQNISIDQYGFIEGVFTNGQSRQLAQILVATFPNRNALTSVGENMFTVSANAGEAYVSEPGESSNTTIQSGALEHVENSIKVAAENGEIGMEGLAMVYWGHYYGAEGVDMFKGVKSDPS